MDLVTWGSYWRHSNVCDINRQCAHTKEAAVWPEHPQEALTSHFSISWSQTHPEDLPRATYRNLRSSPALQRENHVSQLGALCGQWWKLVASRELNIGLPAMSKEKTWTAGSSYTVKSESVEYRYSLREAHLYMITHRKETLQDYEKERQTERLLYLEKHLESFPWGDCSQFIFAEEKVPPTGR